MTCAKALGCGVPVGAFVLDEKTAFSSLAPGDHGTTYGGNPFVCAAVSKVLDIFEQDKRTPSRKNMILSRSAGDGDCCRAWKSRVDRRTILC